MCSTVVFKSTELGPASGASGPGPRRDHGRRFVAFDGTATDRYKSHMGKMIDFKRPDGQSVQGYLAEPARVNAPGIVVIQVWWGLNDQIKGVANKLAAADYRALFPVLCLCKLSMQSH